MYKIVTPVWKKEPADPLNPFVHSFYGTMFGKLYGLDERESKAYIGKEGQVTYSCDFLEPLVREVWEKNKNCMSGFYNIRTSEETGQTAPEYAILKKAGIKNISPVCIRGMGSMAFLFGLQILETAVNEGDCALMLLAEMEHDFAASGENIACAFALYPCKETDSREGIWITDYRLHLSTDEIRDTVKNFRGAAVFSETKPENIPTACEYISCDRHGLTTPLPYLLKMLNGTESADFMAIYVSGNEYGLIQYRVLVKGGAT